MTDEKITATAEPRERLRLRKASTAGFNPVAKNSDTRIKTNIWLTLSNARNKIIAVNTPNVATNPK